MNCILLAGNKLNYTNSIIVHKKKKKRFLWKNYKALKDIKGYQNKSKNHTNSGLGYFQYGNATNFSQAGFLSV